MREKSVEALGKEYPDYFIKKVSIDSQKHLGQSNINTVKEEAETSLEFKIGIYYNIN